MSHRRAGAAVLAAVRSAPAADLPRLVFADWLDENGEPERAEFVRVQIDLARRPAGARGLRPLRRREWELWDAHAEDWFDPIDFIGLEPHLPSARHPGERVALVRRGFVDEVWLSPAHLAGGPCRGCDATSRPRVRPARPPGSCPLCGGAAVTAGVAATCSPHTPSRPSD